jgi:hypothetical protein
LLRLVEVHLSVKVLRWSATLLELVEMLIQLFRVIVSIIDLQLKSESSMIARVLRLLLHHGLISHGNGQHIVKCILLWRLDHASHGLRSQSAVWPLDIRLHLPLLGE